MMWLIIFIEIEFYRWDSCILYNQIQELYRSTEEWQAIHKYEIIEDNCQKETETYFLKGQWQYSLCIILKHTVNSGHSSTCLNLLFFTL